MYILLRERTYFKKKFKLYKIKIFTCAFQEVVWFRKITGDNWKDKCDYMKMGNILLNTFQNASSRLASESKSSEIPGGFWIKRNKLISSPLYKMWNKHSNNEADL